MPTLKRNRTNPDEIKLIGGGFDYVIWLKNDPKVVGERLRALREGLKLSQAKIGKLIGTTQSSINRYLGAFFSAS